MSILSSLFSAYSNRANHTEKMIKTGTFRLLDNPRLCASFLSFASAHHYPFPTLEQWQRFLKSDFKAPKKPDRADPFLYKNPEYFGRDDLEARTYRAYIYTKKLEQWQAKNHEAQTKTEKQRSIKARYDNNESGYCRYIFDRASPEDQLFLQQAQIFYISEEERKRHTYISGGTGSGKSEKIKNLIHHYLTENTETAIVLIDPHGKIAEEVAHFPENQDPERLVFIAPDFDLIKSPVFNPFNVGKGLNRQGLDIAVQELIGAFREILGDMSFSPQMETLLKPCISTLLLYPEGNLYHLQQMMDEQEAKPFLVFADKMLSNPAQKQFLKTDFLKKSYQPSRQSIRTKIQSLLNSQIFLNFTLGKSSFSLEDCIQQKKLIIFSLSRNTGAETSDTIGRFILSSLQSLAMQRAGLTGEDLEKAPAIHVFIDECQHYVTPSIETILTEARKYKLYLTLANQFLEQIDDRRIRNAIKGNTAIKITGRQVEPNTLESISKITGAPIEDIKDLKTGQYLIKSGTLESTKVEGETNLLDLSHSMDTEAWEKTKQQQLEKYYLESANSLTSSPSAIAKPATKAKKVLN